MTLSRSILNTRHRMLPNPRTCTLTPQNPAATAISLPRAYRRPWTQDEIAYNPVATEDQKAAFILPYEYLGSTVPKAGDKITDDESNDWLIRGGVSRELEGAYFRCLCTDWKGTT